MDLTIEKSAVIEGIQNAASLLPARGATYLRVLWFKAETGRMEILSTDGNMEFRCALAADVQTPGEVGVPGKQFVELLRRLPDGPIRLRVEDEISTLHVEQGRKKYRMPVQDVQWMPTLAPVPTEEELVLWSGGFLREIIDRVGYCAASDDADALGCIFLNPAGDGRVEAVALDGFRFAMSEFTNDSLYALLPPEGILVHGKYFAFLSKWLREDEISLAIDDKRLFVRSEMASEVMSIPLSSYNYPDYKTFLSRIADDAATRVKTSKDELQGALKRLGLFAEQRSGSVYFTFSGQEMSLSATSQELGSATETLDVAEYSGTLKKVVFPIQKLLTALDHYDSPEIALTLTGEESPCGISGVDDVDYLTIVMPVKVAKEHYTEEA